MENTSKKIKAVNIFAEHLEPTLFKHGFRRYKKGYYVRMRGEILQTFYFYLYRQPAYIRYGAFPYWVAEEEVLREKSFDSLGYRNVSDEVDRIEGHDDRKRYQMDPSYRRWEYTPNDPEELNAVAALYAEKTTLHIFPILDSIVDFESCIKIMGYPSTYGVQNITLKYDCVRNGSPQKVIDFLKEEEMFAKNNAQDFLIRKEESLKNSIESDFLDDIPLPIKFQKKHQKLVEEWKSQLVELQSLSEEEKAKRIEIEYQNDLKRLRELYKDFYDAIESGNAVAVFEAEIAERKVKMKKVIKDLLKLEID